MVQKRTLCIKCLVAEDKISRIFILSDLERGEQMLVVLSSSTSAERLRKLMSSEKIHSELIQTPKAYSKGGCSYSLRFNKVNLDDVKSLVSKLRISVRGYYPETN